jgi:hypothetical protein
LEAITFDTSEFEYLGAGSFWNVSFYAITLAPGTVWQINASVLIEASGPAPSQAIIAITENTNTIKSVLYPVDPSIGFVSMDIDALVSVPSIGSSSYSIAVIVKNGTTVYSDGSTVGGLGISPPSGAFYTWLSGHRIA